MVKRGTVSAAALPRRTSAKFMSEEVASLENITSHSDYLTSHSRIPKRHSSNLVSTTEGRGRPSKCRRTSLVAPVNTRVSRSIRCDKAFKRSMKGLVQSAPTTASPTPVGKPEPKDSRANRTSTGTHFPRGQADSERIVFNKGAPVMQTRYKVLSWLLNYTQSSDRLLSFEENRRGITTFRTFFLTAELMDFGMGRNFQDDPSKPGPSKVGHTRDAKAWILGLAAFNMAIKIEENRNKFDYYDLMDLVNKEGPPPGFRKRQWVDHVVACETQLLKLLDWQIGDIYTNSSLGQLECLLNVCNIRNDECPTMAMRIRIGEMLLQLATLLLPEWMVEGVTIAGGDLESRWSTGEGSRSRNRTLQKGTTGLVNILRAHAAWQLASHYELVESGALGDLDMERPQSSLIMACTTPSPEDTIVADNYLCGVLQDHNLPPESLAEATSKSQAIQQHMKALLDYVVDFASRMEKNGSVHNYRKNKRVDPSHNKRADASLNRQQQQNPVGRVPNSCLIPLVSAHRQILQQLAVCCDSETYKSCNAVEKVKAQEWINLTFRASLGYAIRCSNCLEYGHNRRFCVSG